MRLYLEKRDHIKAFSRFPVLTIALLLAIFMSFLVLWSVGVNPFEAYLIVGEEIFLTDYGWQDLLVKITPLLLTGAAVALAAQMKLWNIGAEGQFHMGTFAVTWGA
ncbi:MAG: ABC transporter permease, partial [SAR324 cluster bacterium]|nr:ABC transporter permease [SAR324 cluster bacterium]